MGETSRSLAALFCLLIPIIPDIPPATAGKIKRELFLYLKSQKFSCTVFYTSMKKLKFDRVNPQPSTGMKILIITSIISFKSQIYGKPFAL